MQSDVYLSKFIAVYIRFVCVALLLLYDVTNKSSFDNIRAWLGEIRQNSEDNIIIILLGKLNTLK